MKKLLILFVVSSLLIACGSPKQALVAGDYDKVITDTSISLKKNPNQTKKVIMLQEAYNKATKRDLAQIVELKKTVNTTPENWTKIYDIYDRMEIREVSVLPLLPLKADGRILELDIPDITNEAESAKADASAVLYKKAEKLLATNNKLKSREAYKVLNELVEFNFNYRNARELREKAKLDGSTNVYVKMVNQTGKQLPEGFENDLLSFREGAFTDPWINYSTKIKSEVNYAYEVDLEINQVTIGRDNEQSRQYREQQNVIVGYKNVTDSKGNTVKQPQYQTVYADILEVMQTKPIRVTGNVIYKNYKTKKQIQSIPVQREEAWQNNYAQFRGDQRALTQQTIAKIQNGKKPFPTEKQFMDISGKLLNQVVVQLFEENAQNLK